MQAMSDGGGSVPPTASAAGSAAPGSTAVALMVQPEALAATAARLEAVADKLAECVSTASGRLTPVPPGHDEVSATTTQWLGLQQGAAEQAIGKGIEELRRAADSCRTSAKQYTQTDESFGSIARPA